MRNLTYYFRGNNMFYGPKAKKSETAPCDDYIVHEPHSVDTSVRTDLWKNMKYIRIASIDPGAKNFCIRVEERPYNGGVGVKPILFHRMDFGERKRVEASWPIFNTIINYLSSQLEVLKSCHVLIIEKQLAINYVTTRISQHTITYFMMIMRDLYHLPIIFEIDPKMKGKIFGYTKALGDLKLWSINKAIEILQTRNDIKSCAIIKGDRNTKGKKKGDDYADTILQIEALCHLMNWPTYLYPNVLACHPDLKDSEFAPVLVYERQIIVTLEEQAKSKRNTTLVSGTPFGVPLCIDQGPNLVIEDDEEFTLESIAASDTPIKPVKSISNDEFMKLLFKK